MLFPLPIIRERRLLDKGNPDDVTKVMDQFSINYAMSLILGFYFGGGAVEGFMEKKGKSRNWAIHALLLNNRAIRGRYSESCQANSQKCQAHNLKVVGSNPTPATKNL